MAVSDKSRSLERYVVPLDEFEFATKKSTGSRDKLSAR
jgi:hypothetical protein